MISVLTIGSLYGSAQPPINRETGYSNVLGDPPKAILWRDSGISDCMSFHGECIGASQMVVFCSTKRMTICTGSLSKDLYLKIIDKAVYICMLCTLHSSCFFIAGKQAEETV